MLTKITDLRHNHGRYANTSERPDPKDVQPLGHCPACDLNIHKLTSPARPPRRR